MLTIILATLAAFWSNPLFVRFREILRPFLAYIVGAIVIIGLCFALYTHIEHLGVAKEQAIIAKQVEEKLEEDKARLNDDKADLEVKNDQIEHENTVLKDKIKHLPAKNDVIKHPKASSKAINKHMHDQFKRFEDITK